MLLGIKILLTIKKLDFIANFKHFKQITVGTSYSQCKINMWMLKGEMDPKLKEMCRRKKKYLKNEVDKLKDKK